MHKAVDEARNEGNFSLGFSFRQIKLLSSLLQSWTRCHSLWVLTLHPVPCSVPSLPLHRHLSVCFLFSVTRGFMVPWMLVPFGLLYFQVSVGTFSDSTLPKSFYLLVCYCSSGPSLVGTVSIYGVIGCRIKL